MDTKVYNKTTKAELFKQLELVKGQVTNQNAELLALYETVEVLLDETKRSSRVRKEITDCLFALAEAAEVALHSEEDCSEMLRTTIVYNVTAIMSKIGYLPVNHNADEPMLVHHS